MVVNDLKYVLMKKLLFAITLIFIMLPVSAAAPVTRTVITISPNSISVEQGTTCVIVIVVECDNPIDVKCQIPTGFPDGTMVQKIEKSKTETKVEINFRITIPTSGTYNVNVPVNVKVKENGRWSDAIEESKTIPITVTASSAN